MDGGDRGRAWFKTALRGSDRITEEDEGRISVD